MATEILISSDPWENRVAIFEDAALSELYVEREEKVIGSIYKGKVQNVLPGMGASFVDIGLGRNAFLYVDDINKTPLNIGDVEVTQGRSGWTITEKVSRGDEVLVQIVKEPRGLKGARVSTNITLPGRYLALMPTGKYSGVSRKIESADERNRLKAIMKMIRPDGMATVVRTAAAGVSQAELIADLGVLIRMWHGILETYKRSPAPALIHKDMNLVFKAARDFITPEVERVLIDDAEEYEKVRDFMRLLGPQYVDRIVHYDGGRSLFKDYKIDEELMRLLKPKINLPSGGSIVIESTEALTVIDINSGKFTGGKNLEDTIVKTNIEAAAEIARQVRLRDIGGIIVCDFIDMGSEAARNKVIATLEGVLRRDRTRTTIQSFSALGLLEFTRKRVGKDLTGQLRAACPTCSGLGSVMSPESVAIETFRQIRALGRSFAHSNGRAGAKKPVEHGIVVYVAPSVGAQLEYWYEDEMTNLQREIGARVDVVVDAAMHPEKTRVEVAADGAVPKLEGVRVGDEIDVDVLHARLPNPTSALAVVGNRLVEVENAANAAGQSIRIKIIDVDEDGNIFAEPRTAVGAAAVAADGRRRRRRGGRGRRKPLTAAEQAQELRELAEEAERGLGGRTAAIGISTAAEAEREAETTPHAVVPPLTVVSPGGPPASYFGEGASPNGEGDGRRRRRRRRRRRPGEAAAVLAGIPAQSAAVQTGETDDAARAQAEAVPAAAPAQREDEGIRRRRRRRRRRGRGTGPEGASDIAASGVVADRAVFSVDPQGGARSTGRVAPPEPSRAVARVPAESEARVAVDAPPPSLRAAEEKPKTTRISRRPRVTTRAAAPVASLDATPVAALPGAVDAAATARRTRSRKVAAAVEPVVAAPKVKAAAKPRAKKSAAAEPKPTRAKASTAKAPAAKESSKAKAPAAASKGRKTPARKTPAAKKTTRKK